MVEAIVAVAAAAAAVGAYADRQAALHRRVQQAQADEAMNAHHHQISIKYTCAYCGSRFLGLIDSTPRCGSCGAPVKG